MKPSPFEYVKARSMDDVFNTLERHGDGAKILAGGQSLVPAMNLRMALPEVLIDINGLSDLGTIELDGDILRIGALARHAEVGDSALVASHAPLLAEAVPYIAHRGIRNRGTFGGSLATADPASELPACALALAANINLASRQEKRTVAATDFFKDIYETAIMENELLVSVEIPVKREGERFGFLEFMRRRGDYATAGLAAYASFDGDRVESMRLAFFGIGATAVLAPKTAEAFIGRTIDQATIDNAVPKLNDELEILSDVHTSADVKRHLTSVLMTRVLSGMVQI